MHVMALSRFGNKRDANERDIVDGLRRIGASVECIDVPCDLIVGFRNQSFLLEVKAQAGPRGGLSHAKQTASQREFAARWRGHYAVVRTLDEALAAICATQPPEVDDAA
jgi:hypothetical protein